MQPTPSLLCSLRHSALGTYAAYVAHGLRHPTLLRSRATAAERAMPLPGDTLIENPDWTTDFTAVIHASAADTWPWLVQMGYGRAGYYAWYRFDNGGVASADIVVPELQTLAVGDSIPDGPRASEGFGVWRVDQLIPQRALVLHSRREPWSGREVEAGELRAFIDCSWVFGLSPIDGGRTRLHVRVRARFENAGARGKLLARLARLFFGLGDSVMENTMLDGIRERAEAGASAPARERRAGACVGTQALRS